MKLSDFLERCAQSGHTRVKVVSSGRGHELHRGELAGVTAEYIEALCRDDALPLVRDAQHEYVVTAENEDGVKYSRHTVRVHGGAGSTQDDHRVDPMQTTTPAAVVGHLARMVVDLTKQNTALAMKMVDRDIEEMRELSKLRRAQARRGQFEVESRVVELEAAERQADRERSRELWSRVFSMGEPLIARLLPGGEASALARLRSSFSEAQLAELCALLGPVRFGKLMALDTPEKVAALIIEEVSPGVVQKLLAMLSESQRGLIGAALKTEMERRAKADAPAPATSNGAPS